MVKAKHLLCLLWLLMLMAVPRAQGLNYSLNSGQTQAVLNGGVSYDLLRYPTNVSFDYPEGYLSFNIPLDLTTNKYDLAKNLDGSNEKFTPKVGARQRLNFTFRINVPMLRGVFSYAQSENVNFDLNMNLGTRIQQDTIIRSDTANPQDYQQISLVGAINLPIQYQMGWRTQTFGYVFKPTKSVIVGVNLHRHLFELTANGSVNTNILGNIAVDMPSKSIVEKNVAINYSEEDVYGQVSGNYKGSAWSPSFGVQWGRFTFTSRFGVSTKVRGQFTMKWHVPFFVNPDPKNFNIDSDKLSLGPDSASATEKLARFQTLQSQINATATDSFVLHTETDAQFYIPSGQTITFEAWKKHIWLSYTYIHGNKDGAIAIYHKNEEGKSDLDFGLNTNHFLIMNLQAGRAKMTGGLFLMDMYETGKMHWLSRSVGNKTIESLGGVPIPIANISTTIGSTARVLLELDVLPIPALKTGLVYYF